METVRGARHVLIKQARHPADEHLGEDDSGALYADVPSLSELATIWKDRKQRFEYYGMPDEGWRVNVDSRTCECLLYNKVGCCIHLLHAARELNRSLPGPVAPRRVFINRSVRGASAAANVDLSGSRASQRLSQQRGGRPRGNTPALSL
jgi:hypothetical protein